MQGNYDLIVHKPLKYIAEKIESGREPLALKNISEHYKKNSHVYLDPLESIEILGDRDKLLNKLHSFRTENEHGKIETPQFLSVENKEKMEKVISEGFPLKFPVVCKPFIADGNELSHQCALAYNVEGLREMRLPAVFQPFLDHDGVLYKAYILGDQIYQLTRPSLANYDPSLQRPNLEYFGRISNVRENGSSGFVKGKDLPPEPLVLEMVQRLRKILPITLFGIDLIKEKATGTFCLIDINYFPGYYGVENLHNKLLSIFNRVIEERRKQDSSDDLYR